MSEPRGAVIVAHMYPNGARPFSGPLIANQVRCLAREFPLQVVAPVRRVPPLPRWRNERVAGRTTTEDGFLVRHPKVIAIPFGGLSVETALWPRALQRDVHEAAKAVDAGLVHAHFGIPDGVAGSVLAKQLRLPFLLTLHGSDAMLYPQSRGLRRLLRRAVLAATRIFVVSTAMGEVVADLGADTSRVSLTLGGIAGEWGRYSEAEARRSLGLDGSRLVVWVGRFVEVKQPEIAVAAFAMLRRRDVRLVMIGDGPLRRRVERLAVRLDLGNRISFPGALPSEHIALYDSAANVIINSSSSEGISLASCEALACGASIVAFPVGGLPDIVASGGRCGTLAAAHTVEALSLALEGELSTNRSRSELRLSAERFRLSETLKPVTAIYRSLLAA